MDDRRILVPLDGSVASGAALPYAEAIARATGAELCLFTVTEPAHWGANTHFVTLDAMIEDLRREAVEHNLDEEVVALQERGLRASAATTIGEPADAILNAADKDGVGMVVMSTHGHGGVERWLLGSVADRVMRLCPLPTLLIRPSSDAPSGRQIAFRRLLVPLDGSDASEVAVQPAADLALAAAADLLLVRVEPPLASLLPQDVVFWNTRDLDSEIGAAAQHYLKEVQRRLPAEVRSETVVLRGPVSTALENFSRDRHVDLVLMSTHGRGGFQRLLVGSTADRLVRAGLPTLLVRHANDSTDVPPRAGHAKQ